MIEALWTVPCVGCDEIERCGHGSGPESRALETVERLCESSSHPEPIRTLHTEELLEDGWTRRICLECGQVKFTKPSSERRGCVKVHPDSPCLRCRFYIDRALSRDRWCILEVLVRCPQILTEARPCSRFRENGQGEAK